MIQRLYDARKQAFVTHQAVGKFTLSLPLNDHNSVRAGKTNPPGRLLAIDLGAKRVGVAACDELRMTVRPLAAIQRASWKDLLRQVSEQIETFEARGLVIGLPLNLDGSEGAAAAEAREIAEKFRRSLGLPVYLQDERLTTQEARTRLKSTRSPQEIERDVDSEAAAVILQDFLGHEQP
jgi:putative Holliday junction resolvase